MTHLTATDAATAHGPYLAIEWTEQEHRFEACVVSRAPRQTESISYSPLANFLEMCGAGFHNSVIGGYAIVDLAPGLADCHFSKPEGATPDLRAAGA